MSAGVLAYVMRLPVAGGPLFVVVTQGFVVVEPFVTEDRPVLLDRGAVFDQPIPIVVAALVTHVPEQGSKWFAYHLTPAFAFDVVGFGDVDGDDAVGVSGHDPRRARL